MTPSGDKWDERANRYARDFEDRPFWTGGKVLGAILAVVIVLSIVGGLLSFVGGHADAVKKSVSSPNVVEQNRAIIEDYTQMQAAAANACQAAESKSEEGDPTIVENPALAYNATYRRLQADYDRRMANLYEASLAREFPVPSNLKSYPKVAPTLKAMQAEVC